MWHVVQHRWIKGSDKGSGENVVWTGGRFKEARGQAKQNLYSHFEMMVKHDHYPECWYYVNIEEYSITFYDGEEPLYKAWYEVREIEDVSSGS